MTYWRLHYHLTWATFERRPAITLQREKVFNGVLYSKGEELGLKIHAAGNVDDHVQIVVSIPPKLAVADCVRHLKGASAHAIKHIEETHGEFKWDEGYGVLSVGNVLWKQSWLMPRIKNSTTKTVRLSRFMRESMKMTVEDRAGLMAPAKFLEAFRADHSSPLQRSSMN